MLQYPSTIDKQSIPQLPQAVFEGPIHVYNADFIPQKVIETIKSCPVIGFDTETRPSFEKGVTYQLALVQIACEKECYLIRLTGMPFPDFLREVFCDANICKVGLSCHDDFQRINAAINHTQPPTLIKRLLNKRRKKRRSTQNANQAESDTTFRPQNVIELQTYVKQFGIEDMSLQKIYAIVFGKRISKAQQLSNWEAPELSPSQIQYAALDAWAVREIYLHLRSLAQK